MSDSRPALAPAVERSSHKEEELLLQASQIAEHLREQFAELDRREQNLNEQLAQLDQERRDVRMWAHQCEEEMLQRGETVRAQEAQFAHKLFACEKLVAELEQQEQALAAAREQLADEQARIKDEIARELEVDRAALRQSERLVEAERKQLADEIEAHRQRHEQALAQLEAELRAEKENLRRELASDLDAERADFERAKHEWAVRREAELAEILHEREINEAALQRADAELAAERTRQADELERQRREHERRLAEQREAAEQELIREREAHEAAVVHAEQQLGELRRRQSEQLQRERQEFESALARRRDEFERELEEARHELDHERGILESRVRFQHEHLHKFRDDVEGLQREFRVEQQRTLARLGRREEILRLRSRQLDRYRALLAEREVSVEREHELLARSRRAFEVESEDDRERLRRDREAWESERNAQQAELRREQDMLTVHAENLEARRTRLDQLRAELEETHRRTLELRVSVEDAWAQLSQAAGEEAARRRVDQARQSVAEHHRHLYETLAQQRRELAEAHAQFQRQKDDSHAERQALSQWIAERNQVLRLREEQLGRRAAELETRESAWRTARDGWTREKLEAEHIIRGLLQQLTDLDAGAAESEPAGSENAVPLDEPSEQRSPQSPVQPPHFIVQPAKSPETTIDRHD